MAAAYLFPQYFTQSRSDREVAISTPAPSPMCQPVQALRVSPIQPKSKEAKTHSSPSLAAQLTPEEEDVKISKLMEYATSYDATSLPLIEPSLYSEDLKIRAAALNAVVVLGANEGGAVLRKAADKTKDPKEAVKLLENADWLELPPVDINRLKSMRKVKPTASLTPRKN